MFGSSLSFESIRDKLNSFPPDSSIYLLYKLSEDSGFFTSEGKLMYVVKNNELIGFQNTITEFLSLQTNVKIISVINDAQFPTGYYNVLMFNGDNTTTIFESFIRLCLTYCNSTANIGFVKFFYSLVDLFQLPKAQEFRNLLGLVGELSFMEYVYNNYQHDISPAWHSQKSTYDKYDFVCRSANFEVKTVLKEASIVKIKHKQIFNENNNYLILVKLEINNSGTTLIKFINHLRYLEPFASNFQFQLKVEKELKRINQNEAENFRYKVINVETYKVSSLITIREIPTWVTEVTYNYDLSGMSQSKLSSSFFN